MKYASNALTMGLHDDISWSRLNPLHLAKVTKPHHVVIRAAVLHHLNRLNREARGEVRKTVQLISNKCGLKTKSNNLQTKHKHQI